MRWPVATTVILVLGVVFAWAYWPTLRSLVAAWDREPDYSHGFLVPPLAIWLLWIRRDRFPGVLVRVGSPGLALLALSLTMRVVSGWFHLEAIDGWSIAIWFAGIAWLFGGWPGFRWSLPATAFLLFMVPLPFRVERMLSLPLQQVATRLSCWTLQLLGQPALAEGNVLTVGEHQLEVAQACSGLRIFMGILALAFVYLVVRRRAWWENLLLSLSVIPVALAANSTRIVATALLYQHVSSSAGEKFAHDFSGWGMIPLAVALFWLVLWYLQRLAPEVELVDVRTAVRRGSWGER